MSTEKLDSVISNIKRTIVGKEMLLDTYESPSVNPYGPSVKETMIHFLKLNLVELNHILVDLEDARKDIE